MEQGGGRSRVGRQLLAEGIDEEDVCPGHRDQRVVDGRGNAGGRLRLNSLERLAATEARRLQ